MELIEVETKTCRLLRWVIAVFAFLIVLAAFPLTYDPLNPIKTLLTHITASACLSILVIGTWFEKKPIKFKNYILPLFLIFVLLNFLAAIFGEYSGYSLSHFIKLLSLFTILVAVCYSYRKPAHVWGLICSICVAVSFASIYGFMQRAGIDPFPWDVSTGDFLEGPSTFGNPNIASHTLVLTTILALGYALKTRTKWPMVFVILYLCHFSLTRTRGSLLALGAAAILTIITFAVSRRLKSKRYSVVVTLCVMFIACTACGGLLAYKTWDSTGTPFPFDKTMLLRYHSFGSAARMIQEHPLIGRGAGAYEIDNPDYWTELEIRRVTKLRKVNVHVHNELLEIGVEAGIPASIIYLSILIMGIYICLNAAFRSNDPEKRKLGLTLAAFFIAYLFDGFFGFNYHSSVSGAFLFLIAGSVGVLDHSPDRREEVLNWRYPFTLWRLLVIPLIFILLLAGGRQFVASFYQMKGMKANARDNDEQAYEHLKTASALNPYDWQNPYNLGKVCISLAKREEAKTLLLKTIELNPGHIVAVLRTTQVMFDLSALAVGEERKKKAKETLDYINNLKPHFRHLPEIEYLEGRTLVLLALETEKHMKAEVRVAWEKARTQLLKASQLDGDNSYRRKMEECNRIIARACIELGDFEQAEKAYDEAIKKAQNLKIACLDYYNYSVETGRNDALIDALDWQIHHLRINKNPNPGLLSFLAHLKAEVLTNAHGDTGEIEKSYLVALQEDVGNLDAWSAFCDFTSQSGHYNMFRSTLVRMQADLKEHAGDSLILPDIDTASDSDILRIKQVFTQFSENYEKQEKISADTRKAFKLSLRVIAKEISDAPLESVEKGNMLYRLGMTAYRTADYSAAVLILPYAEKLLHDKMLLACRKYYGIGLVKLKRNAEALSVLRELIGQAPQDLEIRWMLARAHAAEGERKQAREEYMFMLQNIKMNDDMRRVMKAELQQVSSEL